MKLSTTLICGLFALLIAECAIAHPVLEIVERTEVKPLENSNVKAGAEEVPLRVTLGRTFVSTESKDTRQIIDFEKRRVFDVNLATKTYSESSLFKVVGFNAMELRNRVALNKVLAAARPDMEAMTPARMEHLFSLLAPGLNTAIDSAHENGATDYRWQGKELLSISDKSQSLPSGYMSVYWKWLRYRVGGHPKIHAALVARTGVPEQLQVLHQDVGEKIVTQRLTRVTDGPDTPYSLAGLARTAPDREPHLTLGKVVVGASQNLKSIADAALAERDAAAAQGRLLDATLAQLAYNITTGSTGTEWLSGMRERISADQEVRTLFSSLSATNAETATKAVATLTAMRDKTNSPYAYMLDVFAANHHVALQHAPDAQRLFLAALSKNPYLTGAWFDLGKLYYNTFQTADAWACWDAARAINPDYPFKSDIDNMERKMAADNPEFF